MWQVRQPLTVHDDLVAALDAALEGLDDGAVERGHLDLAAQGRLAEGDRHLAQQMIAVALKQRMLAQQDAHNQVAPRRSVFARLAFSLHDELQAMKGPGPHVQLEWRSHLYPAVAVTAAHGSVMIVPRPPQPRQVC